MKTIKHAILWLWVAIYTVFSMVSCTTSTTYHADGSKTVIEGTDPAALAAITATALAFAPKAHVVAQKSTSDLQRVIKGKPITKEEIAHRWQPLNP